MNTKRKISAFPAIVGLLLAIATVAVTVMALFLPPKMVTLPAEAELRAAALMDALCSGDDSGVSAVLYGNPSLGIRPYGYSTADQLWDAYRDSLTYEFASGCYATSTGAAMDVTIRSLDLHQVLKDLDSTVQKTLDQKVSSAKDSSALFAANGELLQSVSDKLLSDGLLLAIGIAPLQERTITLNLTYENGTWWVLPEGGILDVLSGSFAG